MRAAPRKTIAERDQWDPIDLRRQVSKTTLRQVLGQLARAHAVHKSAPVEEPRETHRRMAATVAAACVRERVGGQQRQNEHHVGSASACEELGNVHQHVIDAAAEDDVPQYAVIDEAPKCGMCERGGGRRNGGGGRRRSGVKHGKR